MILSWNHDELEWIKANRVKVKIPLSSRKTVWITHLYTSSRCSACLHTLSKLDCPASVVAVVVFFVLNQKVNEIRRLIRLNVVTFDAQLPTNLMIVQKSGGRWHDETTWDDMLAVSMILTRCRNKVELNEFVIFFSLFRHKYSPHRKHDVSMSRW